MQYNGLVGENEEYYNKVLDWATRNNIAIDTHDMNPRLVKRTAMQELEF